MPSSLEAAPSSALRLGSDLDRLERATADLDPPFALLDLDAFWSNASDMARRAAGKPIRLASKSLRCRSLQAAVLERSGWQGTLSFTLPEALWLAGHGARDIVVAYPTVDRAAIARLPHPDVTVMVDCREHLDLLPEGTQVCLDVDAGWWPLGGRLKIGAKRSPVRTPDAAAALARAALERLSA